MAVVGAAVAGAAIKGVADFVGFDTKMREVFTLLPGISQSAMSQMTGQVKDFSKEFGVLPNEVVPALYQALSAGVPQDNVFQFLETAQKAAKGGVTELATAVNGISSVINAYGTDVLSATQASDLMFTAVRLGKTTFDELSRSLFNVAPIASSLGVNFGEVTAALAAMTSQGVPTSVATTQIRAALVELGDSGTEVGKTFEQVAGVGFKQFIAGGGNLQQALQLLEGHAASSGKGINELFGSVEAGSAALTLTGKGTAAFSANLAAMQASAGATDAAFQTMSGGVGASFDRIKAAIAVGSIELGEKLAPAVKAVTDLLLGETPKWAAALSEAFSGIDWSGVQEALRGALGPIADELQPTVDAIRGHLQAIVGFFQEHWGQIGPIVMPILEQIQSSVQNALTIISNVVQLAMNLIQGDWSGAWQNIKNIGGAILDEIKSRIETVIKLIPAVVTGALALVKGAFDLAWEGIKAGVPLAWEGIKTAISAGVDAAVEFAKGLPGKVVEGLGDLGSLLSEKGKALLDGLLTAAGAAWDGGVSFFSELPGKAVEAVGDLGSTLSEAGTALLTGLHTAATAMWDGTVTGWLGQRGADAVSAIGDLIGTLAGKGRDLLTGLQTGATEVWSTVGAWLGQRGADAVSAIGDLLATLKGKGGDLLTGLWDGAKDVWTSATTWLGDRGKDAVAAVGDLGRSLYEAGQQLIEGMKEGVLSVARSLADAAANVVKAAIKAAKDAILPGSPSKVTRDEIGIPMGKGVEQGILLTKPGVMTALTSLVTDAMSGTAQLVSGASGGSRGLGRAMGGTMAGLITLGGGISTGSGSALTVPASAGSPSPAAGAVPSTGGGGAPDGGGFGSDDRGAALQAALDADFHERVAEFKRHFDDWRANSEFYAAYLAYQKGEIDLDDLSAAASGGTAYIRQNWPKIQKAAQRREAWNKKYSAFNLLLDKRDAAASGNLSSPDEIKSFNSQLGQMAEELELGSVVSGAATGGQSTSSARLSTALPFLPHPGNPPPRPEPRGARPIPFFGRGTDSAPGGLAVVGEFGPELVNLPRGSRVHSADDSKRMAGGMTIVVTGNQFMSDQAIDEFTSILARKIDRLQGNRTEINLLGMG